MKVEKRGMKVEKRGMKVEKRGMKVEKRGACFLTTTAKVEFLNSEKSEFGKIGIQKEQKSEKISLSEKRERKVG